MRIFLYLFLIGIFFYCDSGVSKVQDLTLALDEEAKLLNFKATFKNKPYTLKVNCSQLHTNNFQFQSDSLNNKDANGSGIVVSGFLKEKKLAVSFLVNNKLYSTSKLDVWSKLKNKVYGDGYLYSEDGREKFDFQFQLICN